MFIQKLTSLKFGQSKQNIQQNPQKQDLTSFSGNATNTLKKDTVSFTGIWFKDGSKVVGSAIYGTCGELKSSTNYDGQKYHPYSWETKPTTMVRKNEYMPQYMNEVHKSWHYTVSGTHPDFSLRDFDDATNYSKPQYIDPANKKYYLINLNSIETSDIDTTIVNRLDRQSSLHELQKDLNYRLNYISEYITENNDKIAKSETKINEARKRCIAEGGLLDSLKYELGIGYTEKGRYNGEDKEYKDTLKKCNTKNKELEIEKATIANRIKTSLEEENFLSAKRNAGNLIDISAQNYWTSNEPMYNFLNWAKDNKQDTKWIQEKYVATPFETVKVANIILEAHDYTAEILKGIKLEHQELLLKGFLNNDNFVETVMKQVGKITKVL